MATWSAAPRNATASNGRASAKPWSTPTSPPPKPCVRSGKIPVDFDNTENLYIEGDNLEVLKILQESYLGKVKMIYIDPPYNTGKDFVYKDNFTQDSDEYKEESGQTDEYNRRLVSNPDTSGRYHSDWLSMMYPRLKLARNLLTEDGVILFQLMTMKSNLTKLCDEILGEKFCSNNCVDNGKSKNDASSSQRSHKIFQRIRLSGKRLSWRLEKKGIQKYDKPNLLEDGEAEVKSERALKTVSTASGRFETKLPLFLGGLSRGTSPITYRAPGGGGRNGTPSRNRQSCKTPSRGWDFKPSLCSGLFGRQDLLQRQMAFLGKIISQRT